MLRLLEELKVNLRKKTKYTVNHKSDLKEIKDILTHMLDAVEKQELDMKQVDMKVLNINREIKSD